MSHPARTRGALAAFSLIAVLCLTGGSRAFPRALAPVSEVPFQFQAGQVARASEVNQNFAALITLVDDLQFRIDTLEAQLAVVEDSTQLMTVSLAELNGLAGPHLIIEGANVHVRSGSGATDDLGTPGGLGNRVIGYDEEAAGQVPGERSGAHDLVLGREHLGDEHPLTAKVLFDMEVALRGLGLVEEAQALRTR